MCNDSPLCWLISATDVLSDDLSVTYMLGSNAVAPSDVAPARVPPAGLEFPGLLVYPNGVNSQVNLTEKGGNIKQIATDFFLLPCFSLRSSQHNIKNLLGDSQGEVLKKCIYMQMRCCHY